MYTQQAPAAAAVAAVAVVAVLQVVWGWALVRVQVAAVAAPPAAPQSQ